MHQVQRERESRRHALGKRISEFGEQLAVSPLDQIDATIREGFGAIIELVEADRICWYEVEEESGALLHKYTGCNRDAPLLTKIYRLWQNALFSAAPGAA